MTKKNLIVKDARIIAELAKMQRVKPLPVTLSLSPGLVKELDAFASSVKQSRSGAVSALVRAGLFAAAGGVMTEYTFADGKEIKLGRRA